ncbi:hypothetical protein TNCV_3652811 [Trichonephila clavipes]|nr:hypothetical protein TNCV_3652811 [Trichonephila clavipes]
MALKLRSVCVCSESPSATQTTAFSRKGVYSDPFFRVANNKRHERERLTTPCQPACLPRAAPRKEKNGVLGIPLRSLWPPLHCRRVSGLSAVPGFWPDERHTASFVGLRVRWRPARTKLCFALRDPSRLCRGQGPLLSKTDVKEIAANSRYLLISLVNDDMSKKSPFTIPKALRLQWTVKMWKID